MLNLNKILEPAKTIAIGGHVRPDGDCVGSKGRMRFYMRLTRVNIMICSLYWTVEIPEDWSFLCHCS